VSVSVGRVIVEYGIILILALETMQTPSTIND